MQTFKILKPDGIKSSMDVLFLPYSIRASALETRRELGMEVRQPISLRIGTKRPYVDFCNMRKFQLQRTFLAEFSISAPHGSLEADFQ